MGSGWYDSSNTPPSSKQRIEKDNKLDHKALTACGLPMLFEM
jgi:hypothetical protein